MSLLDNKQIGVRIEKLKTNTVTKKLNAFQFLHDNTIICVLTFTSFPLLYSTFSKKKKRKLNIFMINIELGTYVNLL